MAGDSADVQESTFGQGASFESQADAWTFTSDLSVFGGKFAYLHDIAALGVSSQFSATGSEFLGPVKITVEGLNGGPADVSFTSSPVGGKTDLYVRGGPLSFVADGSDLLGGLRLRSCAYADTVDLLNLNVGRVDVDLGANALSRVDFDGVTVDGKTDLEASSHEFVVNLRNSVFAGNASVDHDFANLVQGDFRLTVEASNFLRSFGISSSEADAIVRFVNSFIDGRAELDVRHGGLDFGADGGDFGGGLGINANLHDDVFSLSNLSLRWLDVDSGGGNTDSFVLDSVAIAEGLGIEVEAANLAVNVLNSSGGDVSVRHRYGHAGMDSQVTVNGSDFSGDFGVDIRGVDEPGGSARIQLVDFTVGGAGKLAVRGPALDFLADLGGFDEGLSVRSGEYDDLFGLSNLVLGKLDLQTGPGDGDALDMQQVAVGGDVQVNSATTVDIANSTVGGGASFGHGGRHIQVPIEARFLSVNSSFLRDLAVDFRNVDSDVSLDNVTVGRDMQIRAAGGALDAVVARGDIQGDVQVRSGEYSDAVQVIDSTVGGLNIDTGGGDGDDTVEATGVTVAGEAKVKSSGRSAQVTFTNSHVGGGGTIGPQVLIEARIIIANTDFARELGVNWSGATSTFSLDDVTIGGDATLRSRGGATDFSANMVDFGSGADLRLGDAPDSVTFQNSTAGGLSVNLGCGHNVADFLNVDVDTILKVLARKGNDTILASPVLVGQKAEFDLGDGENSLDLLNSTVGGSVDVKTGKQDDEINVEYSEIGLKLRVTPGVGNDSVILLHLDVADEMTIKMGNGNDQTTIIGGIYRHLIKVDAGGGDDLVEVGGVPILAPIPFLNRFFGGRGDDTFRRTPLLLLIQPSITGFEYEEDM